MEKVRPYPKEILKLMTFPGFMMEFYAQLKNTDTDAEAYEAAETTYIKYFGKRKYSNYKAFRVVRARNKKL